MITWGNVVWNFAFDEMEDHDIVDKNPFARLGFKKPAPPGKWCGSQSKSRRSSRLR
jgi:hypothetical protein